MKEYEVDMTSNSVMTIGENIMTRGRSPSTWLGYKTVSRRYKEFITARLDSYPPRMRDD